MSWPRDAALGFTVSRPCAAGLKRGWQDYYYFLAAVGQASECMAMLLLRLLVRQLLPEGPVVFGIDDTPTKRYGPKVEGGGLHHNPTPGPARHKLLYGHLWVTLVWIVHHPVWALSGCRYSPDFTFAKWMCES